MNRTTLIGLLGSDPEYRTTQNGKELCSFSLCTTDFRRNGDAIERIPEWHRVVIFNPTAVKYSKVLGKGDKVFIEGRLKTRDWVDNDGVKRYMTEIVVSGYEGKLEHWNKFSNQDNDVPVAPNQFNQDYDDSDIPF